MSRWKTPGSDGFPMEFFVSFWDLLGPDNIGAFCLRMRENRSVRLQMADFKGFVSFVMVFMKNMD
jgi:hypothetical protein